MIRLITHTTKLLGGRNYLSPPLPKNGANVAAFALVGSMIRRLRSVTSSRLPEQWLKAEARLEGQCKAFSYHLTRDGSCPFCHRTSYSRHFMQCAVLMQTALMRLQFTEEPAAQETHHHGGRAGQPTVATLGTSSAGPQSDWGQIQKKRCRDEKLSPSKQTAPLGGCRKDDSQAGNRSGRPRSAPSKASAAARGQSECALAGHSIYALLKSASASGYSLPAVQNQPEVAPREREKPRTQAHPSLRVVIFGLMIQEMGTDASRLQGRSTKGRQ